MNCPEIERIDNVQGNPPRTKRLKPEEVGEPYPNQSGRHLRPELEKGGGGGGRKGYPSSRCTGDAQVAHRS